MRIAFMNGGLGNQVFQYIFFRWLEITTTDSCIIDDSAFYGENVPHNGYELERLFGIKTKLLSGFFDRDIWNYMVKQRKGPMGIAQQLLDGGLEFKVLFESGTLTFSGEVIQFGKDAFPPKLDGNVYYHGYYLGSRYFSLIESIIRKELQFPAIVSTKNRDYQAMIKASNSVAVHIRRGDMVSLGWTASPDYFANQIQAVEESVSFVRYFVFSDDLAWCQDHSAELGLNGVADRLVWIHGNSGANAYVDLQLMSLCKYLIANSSSFSALAGLLNNFPGKKYFSRP
jgi:hypothetical protein